MKKQIIRNSIFLLFLLFIFKFVIAQDSIFQTVFGGSGDESYPRIINAGNNEFLILNRTYSNNFGDIDVMLTKIDLSGVPIWTKNIGNSSRNYSKTIHKTDDGFIILSWHSDYSKVDDWCIIKLDPDGNIIKHKFFGVEGIDEEVHYSLQLANGSYAMAASLRVGTTNPMISFMDKELNVLKSLYFEVPGYDHLVRGLTLTEKGDLILCGSHNSKPLFLSVDEDGGFNFMKYVNFSGFSEVRQIIIANANSVIAVGFTDETSDGSYNILVVKMSNLGELLWVKTYGGTGNDKAFDIKRKSDDTFLITGETSSFGQDKDVFIINIDQSGSFLEGFRYGGEKDEHFGFFDFTDDNGVIIVSQTESYETGSSDILIIRATEDGKSCDSREITDIRVENISTNLNTLYPYISVDFRNKISHPFLTNEWIPNYSDVCTAEIPIDTTSPPFDTTTYDTIIQYNLNCNLLITNVITPNNDGKGDHVFAIFEKDISHFEFRIYNIRGALLFKTYDKNFRWDGKINGSTLPNGTYIYTCNYLCTEAIHPSYDWGKIIITR